jgi:hypothetical protein
MFPIGNGECLMAAAGTVFQAGILRQVLRLWQPLSG